MQQDVNSRLQLVLAETIMVMKDVGSDVGVYRYPMMKGFDGLELPFSEISIAMVKSNHPLCELFGSIHAMLHSMSNNAIRLGKAMDDWPMSKEEWNYACLAMANLADDIKTRCTMLLGYLS